MLIFDEIQNKPFTRELNDFLNRITTERWNLLMENTLVWVFMFHLLIEYDAKIKSRQYSC